MSQLLIRLSTLFVVCAYTFNANAEAATITVTSERREVQIADPFKIEIRVQAEIGTEVRFPEVPEQIGQFDVLSHQDSFDLPDAENAELKTWIRRFTLETLETGSLQIPAFEVSAIESSGERRLLQSQPISIRVLSVLEQRSDTSKFSDIQGVIDVPGETRQSFNWIVWAGSAIGLVAFASGLFAAATRRRQWLSPAQLALSELATIPGSDVGKIERILRGFLEDEFQFPATSLHANEIISRLEEFQISADLKEEILQALSTCEKIRFAGLAVDNTTENRLAGDVEQLIRMLDELMSKREAA